MGSHPLNETHRSPGSRTPDVLEIAVNGLGLLREGSDQVALVVVGIAADAQVEAGVDKPVVGIGHAVPLQLATGEIVEVGAALASGADLPYVVHPHVPGGPVAPEGVGQSTRLRVPLQDENPLAGSARQQTGSRQPSDTRTDHDHVVGHSSLQLARQCQVSIAVNWTVSSSVALHSPYDV